MPLPVGPDWPDIDEYRKWARVPDSLDDVAIDQALLAVQEAIVNRCPTMAIAPCPNDVQYACLLWTNRVLNRRNSPDGVVGVADLGIATIKSFDKDIQQLLSPYTAAVLA